MDNTNEQNNPFKELNKEAIPSTLLKERVLSSARMSDLLLSTLDLFSVKAAKTIGTFFDNEKDK